MSKTYEELESENQMLEVTLERQQLRLNEWVALHTECLTELNDTRAENNFLETRIVGLEDRNKKLIAKLARVKAKTCKDCVKLFEEMAEKQLASRSCKTCALADYCYQTIKFVGSEPTPRMAYSKTISHCTLWEAKK